ncbi:MAG: HDIG domain-containing protein [Candidatus Thermoplasmatota archaeon]
MKETPNQEKCIQLLKECGCSDDIIMHCCAVRDIAKRIAIRAGADVALVEAGALLHDIGRAKTHGIQHAIEGAKIARKKGLPTTIIRIIERHIGAGIPKDEARCLGLPNKDFLPISLEEKIVAHADNLTHGDHQQCIEDEIQKALDKGQKKHAQRLRQLHDELSAICGIDLNEI